MTKLKYKNYQKRIPIRKTKTLQIFHIKILVRKQELITYQRKFDILYNNLYSIIFFKFYLIHLTKKKHFVLIKIKKILFF
jgi:hypothetical protein